MSVPSSTPAGTVRLTVAQALVRFLAAQFAERDGVRDRLIPGTFGIFGHGNVAGIGQALLQNATDPADGENPMPYYQARNEQNMVHTAVAYARTTNRLQAFACAASIGPGSTNMITGAALATVDRIPVLLLPSDIFATRTVDPVLQQLEDETAGDVSVNDAFRPVSRYFDRISRPEQLIPAALQAMRVLTDPAETGAVTLSLPQDVQAEAFDWPLEFFRERTWHVARPVPEPAALAARGRRRSARPVGPCSSPAAAPSTPRRARRSRPSPTPPGSRCSTPRPARARSARTTRSRSAAWARPATTPPTSSPRRPT